MEVHVTNDGCVSSPESARTYLTTASWGTIPVGGSLELFAFAPDLVIPGKTCVTVWQYDAGSNYSDLRPVPWCSRLLPTDLVHIAHGSEREASPARRDTPARLRTPRLDSNLGSALISGMSGCLPAPTGGGMSALEICPAWETGARTRRTYPTTVFGRPKQTSEPGTG